MKKILFVFGTRPEAIKLAPVINELKIASSLFHVSICVTGQHRSMLDQVLKTFRIRPDYDLNLMRPGQDLFSVTSGVLQGMKRVLEKECPDMVIVQGDTTTTLAAALAAFYLRIPVGHVEAGLRTWDKHAPFPEEINRKVATCVADLHFAPTRSARDNLLREGVSPGKVYITGNTVIDALLGAVSRLRADGRLRRNLSRSMGFLDAGKRLILVTGHRRENFGETFRQICLALKDVARKYPDCQIVYPVHLNPAVQAATRKLLSRTPAITLLPPQEYMQFVYLMERAHLILTDSGGIQEEAPSLGKPVLVLRSVTERPEGLDAGTVRLAGTGRKKIVAAVSRLMDSKGEYFKMSRAKNPYGSGDSSKKIAAVLRRWAKGN